MLPNCVGGCWPGREEDVSKGSRQPPPTGGKEEARREYKELLSALMG